VQHPAFHARHAPRRQAEAAADATLLIHEATFEDPAPGADWREVALAKRHSMTGEAVEIGVRARAFRTILTHFSQRYPKIPAIGASFTASTCIAFDLLSVNLAGAPAATCPGRARAQQPLNSTLGCLSACALWSVTGANTAPAPVPVLACL